MFFNNTKEISLKHGVGHKRIISRSSAAVSAQKYMESPPIACTCLLLLPSLLKPCLDSYRCHTADFRATLLSFFLFSHVCWFLFCGAVLRLWLSWFLQILYFSSIYHFHRGGCFVESTDGHTPLWLNQKFVKLSQWFLTQALGTLSHCQVCMFPPMAEST